MRPFQPRRGCGCASPGEQALGIPGLKPRFHVVSSVERPVLRNPVMRRLSLVAIAAAATALSGAVLGWFGTQALTLL